MKLDEFVHEAADANGIPEKLAHAVIKSLGGWSDLKENAPDVAKHDADSGFSGFIYYNDTIRFARRNLPAILTMAENQARDCGSESVAAMIAGFNCLKNSTVFEVEQVLMHPSKDTDDAVMVLNALAWYALEEICRAYNDAREAV